MAISAERLTQLKEAASKAKGDGGKGSQHVSVPAAELAELCEAATVSTAKPATTK